MVDLKERSADPAVGLLGVGVDGWRQDQEPVVAQDLANLGPALAVDFQGAVLALAAEANEIGNALRADPAARRIAQERLRNPHIIVAVNVDCRQLRPVGERRA